MSDQPLILAERADGGIRIHPTPLPLRWELHGLVAADGHVIHCTFAARIRALPAEAEKLMLAEAMMAARQRVTLDDARAHFHSALRAAAARTVATASAEKWLGPADAASSSLQQALLDTARATAFTCGIELLPPFELIVDSPSLAHARAQALHQQDLEQRHRRRAQIVQTLLGADASAAPNLPDASDPAAYVEYVAAMIDVQAMRHPRATLHAVCGQMLISTEVTAGEVADPRMLALPDDVGAMRSIGYANDPTGSRQLLLGGQRGVLAMNPAYPSFAVAYRHPSLASQMGYNQALRWRDRIWASHSEAGLTSWAVDAPDQPLRNVSRDELGAAPRHLTVVDDELLMFAAGQTLLTIDQDGRIERRGELPSAPLAVAVIDDGVCIIRADGAMEIRDRQRLVVQHVQPAGGGNITAATVFACLNQPLRLLGCVDGHVQCRGDAELAVRSFACNHRDLRLVRAAPAYIAGLSADRSRAVVWSTRSPQPLAELHLAALTQHRIADFAWEWTQA